MNLTFKEACSAVADVFEFCPEAWTKNKLARDIAGQAVSPDDPDAASWCLVGALVGVLGKSSREICKLAVHFGYDHSVDLNNRGGRLLTIKMRRIAAGELTK